MAKITVTAVNYTAPIGTVLDTENMSKFDLENLCYLSKEDKEKELAKKKEVVREDKK